MLILSDCHRRVKDEADPGDKSVMIFVEEC
jgi:hypothetical protein